MKRRDDERRSVLGLGAPPPGSELSKGRPSTAGQARNPDANPDANDDLRIAGESQAQEWPSAQGQDAAEGHSGAEERRAENPLQRNAARNARADDSNAWRPSDAVKGRLASLAPVRRRRKFALPRSIRFLASAALFAIGMYAFAKLWTMPTETDLHPALEIFGAALVLLLIAAVASMVSRRRRARDDEKSTLRL